MQEYFINEQIEGFNQVRQFQSKFKSDLKIMRIIERAINEWPEDYSMQVHIINEQLDSLGRL